MKHNLISYSQIDRSFLPYSFAFSLSANITPFIIVPLIISELFTLFLREKTKMRMIVCSAAAVFCRLLQQIESMGVTATSICSACLSGQQAGNGEYAYESYKKIPFVGPINEYLKLVKEGKTGGSFIGGIGSLIGSALMPQKPLYQPDMPGQLPPEPAAPTNWTQMLVNSLPLNSIKAGDQNLLDLVKEDSVVKKIKKSNYAEILKKYESAPNQHFVDSQFPPAPSSLGKIDGQDISKIKWKRVGQIISDPIFVKDKIEAADILQGSLGDCYFLSALAALAEQDYRIKNIFPSLQISKSGAYMARILHNGIYQEVVIDDYFPVDEKGKVYFAQPAGGKEIWVMILQKCWAKLYGSFSSIVGGLPDQVLHAFSSAPVFYRPLKGTKQKQEQIWKQMLINFKQGALLCCGTKGDASIEDKGFVRGHAYTILGVYDSPYRLIKVRNPWGRKEWKGRASDFDTEFWSKISAADKQSLDYNDDKRKTNTDGVFFILWEDFLIYYQLIDICKINDNANYNFTPISFSSLKPKLFEIQVQPDSSNRKLLTLALTQRNSRGRGQQIESRGYSRSFMALGKLNPRTNKYEYVHSNSAKTFPDNYLEVENAEPGKYLLYAKYLWNNGADNAATISAYSPSVTLIKENSEITSSNFLSEIFYNHASRNSKKKVLSSSPQEWICSDMLLNNGGFGYLVVHLDPESKNKLGVELDQSEYLQKKISFEGPNKGRGKIQQQVTAGKPYVIVFELPVETFPTSVTLPPPKVSQLQ